MPYYQKVKKEIFFVSCLKWRMKMDIRIIIIFTCFISLSESRAKHIQIHLQIGTWSLKIDKLFRSKPRDIKRTAQSRSNCIICLKCGGHTLAPKTDPTKASPGIKMTRNWHKYPFIINKITSSLDKTYWSKFVYCKIGNSHESAFNKSTYSF